MLYTWKTFLKSKLTQKDEEHVTETWGLCTSQSWLQIWRFLLLISHFQSVFASSMSSKVGWKVEHFEQGLPLDVSS